MLEDVTLSNLLLACICSVMSSWICPAFCNAFKTLFVNAFRPELPSKWIPSNLPDFDSLYLASLTAPTQLIASWSAIIILSFSLHSSQRSVIVLLKNVANDAFIAKGSIDGGSYLGICFRRTTF